MDSWNCPKSGSLSYIVVLLDGTTVRRHIDSIKARHVNPDTITLPEEDETFQIGPELTSSISSTDLPDNLMPTNNAMSPEIVTSSRPVRTQRPPTRFDGFVTTEEVSEL